MVKVGTVSFLELFFIMKYIYKKKKKIQEIYPITVLKMCHNNSKKKKR